MFQIILLFILFSTSLIAGKLCFAYISPSFLVALRTALASAFMFGYMILFDRKLFKSSLYSLMPYISTAFLVYYLPSILRYWALQYVPASTVSFFFNFEPLVAAFFSYLIFNHRLTARQWGALLVGIFAMIVFTTSSTKQEALLGGIFFISWAELALIIGIISSGCGIVLLKHYMHKHAVSPLIMNAYATFLCSIWAFITAWIFEPKWILGSYSSFIPASGYILYMVLASNVFNRTLYAHLIKIYSATFMAYAAFLGPIITAIIGWFILGETVSWQFFVAGIIVFFGIYIFHQEDRKKDLLLKP